MSERGTKLARRLGRVGPAAALMTAALVAVGCGGGGAADTGEQCRMPPPPSTEPVGDIFVDKIGDPVPFATPKQRDDFEKGFAIAKHRFTPVEGLGPDYNVTSCLSCHNQPVLGGGGEHWRDFLLIGTKNPDGTVSFGDDGHSGVLPQFRLMRTANPDYDPNAPTSPDNPKERVTRIVRRATESNVNLSVTRTAIPFWGVGLVAQIPEESILAHADPDDCDGDGISGRPNMIKGFVGRFGVKAQTDTLEGFVRGPIVNHAGITSDPLPKDLQAQLPVPSVAADADSIDKQVAAPSEPLKDGDAVPDPELGPNDLFDLVSFSMLLGPPRPDAPTPETTHGEQVFNDVGCADCHVKSLDSPRGPIPLYSDLLIHDMGPDLADGIPMGGATGSEFRTSPLWGVAALGAFLHDGRASTLDDAIRWHGGEAQRARDGYVALAQTDRDAVLAFLRSLGGASQHTIGSLYPDSPVPAQGEYGAPLAGLSSDELAAFKVGRTEFDRRRSYESGMGAHFNGDSCRACHSDPVIGGSGPLGVNASRQGSLPLDPSATQPDASTLNPPIVLIPPDGFADFSAPSGTPAPHFASNDTRPLLDPTTTVTETRQTPMLFGFGLIDQISDETIRDLADSEMTANPAMAGRVFETTFADGTPTVGKFGWKGSAPRLKDFTRDALCNEMGMTMPPDPDGLSRFGCSTDDDGVPDPEVSTQIVDEITDFTALLAPPPRQASADSAEAVAGAEVFNQVGCGFCHVPTLQTASGANVPLFSDLLLHDVADPNEVGIVEGMAGIHDFRTPPLWGLAKSAPYMHDGRAATVELAIAAHHGQADSVREAFNALSPTDRANLLAFLRSL